MPRAPFQVLVFPFRRTEDDRIEYAIFKRSDAHYWQAIAGGGEDEETPPQAARREAYEEADIPQSQRYIELSSRATVPVVSICGFNWGEDVLVIPEYCFGVEVTGRTLKLSHEHSEFCWTDYDGASSLLRWDSNKNALWELNVRLNEFNRPRACAALIVNNHILMVQHREKTRSYWTLPGGGIELGETPAEAAAREMREETNIRAHALRLLYAHSYDHVIDGRKYTSPEYCFLMAPESEDAIQTLSLGDDPEELGIAADARMLKKVGMVALDAMKDDLQISRVLQYLNLNEIYI